MPIDVHKLAIDAGKSTLPEAKQPSQKDKRRENKITVTLKWVECPEPNVCMYTFDRFVFSIPHNIRATFAKWSAYDKKGLEDNLRQKHVKRVGADALTTMTSKLPTTAKIITRSIGGASAKDSKLVLCNPLPTSPSDNSIHSLETLFTEASVGATDLSGNVHEVRLEAIASWEKGCRIDKESRKEVASLSHDKKCKIWICKAEQDIKDNVLKHPEDYEFDEKNNEFVHRDKKYRSTLRYPTHSQIETPFVNRDRYNVCIDGYIALKARRAVAHD